MPIYDVKDIRRGEPITAAYLNKLKNGLIKEIIGGRGISIKRSGGKIIIENTLRVTHPPSGAGGGGYYSRIDSYQTATSTYTIAPWDYTTSAWLTASLTAGVYIPESGGTITAGTTLWVGIDSNSNYVGFPYSLYKPWSA